MLLGNIFDNKVLGFINDKIKNKEPKKKKYSIILDLINNPDNAEINIKKENDEIVIRIKKSEIHN